MAATAKKIVKSFLESDAFIDPSIFDNYIHEKLDMHWHASTGFRKFNYEEYRRLSQSTAASYESMRTDITHMISEKNEVAARFTVYVRTLENPREEIPIGYFISIFAIQDDKIITVHQTSHPTV